MKLKLILLMVMLFVVQLAAQENELTLDDAIKIALKNNRQIEIAKMDVQKAEEKVSEAFGYALPSVDVSAGYTHFLQKPKMSFPDFEAMLNNSTYGVLFNEGIIPYDASKFMPMDFKLQTFAQSDNFKTEANVSQILFNSAVFRGIGASEIYLNLAKENLKRIQAAEELLLSRGFGLVRVRDHGLTARIEIGSEEFPLLLQRDLREKVVKEFKELGYTYVTFDLEGYRTGSMNEMLKKGMEYGKGAD